MPRSARSDREAGPRGTGFLREEAVFATFSNNHHNDGHVAVWMPAQPGALASLVASFPAIYYRLPYVGVKGRVGIKLSEIGNDELAAHIGEAWRLINNSRRT